MDTNLGTVSLWIAQAKTGDDIALAQLHYRYWSALVQLAKKRMARAPCPDRDAEDIAQDAFIALCHSMRSGKIPKLRDRNQLIAFLSHIIACKTVNEYKRNTTQKRGGGTMTFSDSRFLEAMDQRDTPMQEALVKDCYQFYLDCLPDHLRQFAELHLAGLNSTEIAAQLGCVKRTVERKLQLLKMFWKEIALDHFDDLLDSGDC